MLERTLANVEPILKAETTTVKPLVWQNELSLDRLHNDQAHNRLGPRDIKKNARNFFEDYVVIGVSPGEQVHKQANHR